MARKYRGTIEVNLKDRAEVIRVLSDLRLELQEKLLGRFGSRFGIVVDDLAHDEDFAELLGMEEGEGAVLQTFKLCRGSREGAILEVDWRPFSRRHLVVSAKAVSKVESGTMALFVGVPSVVLGLTGLFLWLSWFVGILGAVIGAGLGFVLHLVLARPIVALVVGRRRQTNQALAAELFSFGFRWVRESVAVGSGKAGAAEEAGERAAPAIRVTPAARGTSPAPKTPSSWPADT